MKLIEYFNQSKIKSDWKTQYIRYRLGRLKHQYWLWNRKSADKMLIDEFDYFILQNCQDGKTAFFSSSGYYLKDIYPEIVDIEMHPVVKTFYPNAIICEDRTQLGQMFPQQFDNFAVVNNRGDLWVKLDEFYDTIISHYVKTMRPGCRFFYTIRDTQFPELNRLTTDLEDLFLSWAKSLERHKLKLVWYDINFKRKVPDDNGYYDMLENPDTTNGNLKFAFVYDGDAWTIKI
jgi:hypothetical protein